MEPGANILSILSGFRVHTAINVRRRKLGKILGGPESEHLGYNPAHGQRPCLDGHGRGLDRGWIDKLCLEC